jgi:pyruvate,water dikinase
MNLNTKNAFIRAHHAGSDVRQLEARELAGIELHGTAASSGRYSGRVCVINNESEIHKLRAGDVLVCQSASPAWTVLFPHVGALVIENGGVLSASLSIAREHGIPAVVGTRLATQQLREGQIVEVDGDQGHIVLVQRFATALRRRGCNVPIAAPSRLIEDV